MANESFNSNVEAVTHDSDPKKLQFVTISQDPSRLFQQGETNLNRFGAAVDLANAHGLGDILTPAVAGPVLSNLAGGAGNKVTFRLQPPAVTPPYAKDLSTGDFTTAVHTDEPATKTIANYPASRMAVDGGLGGELLQQWKAPLGNVGAYLRHTLAGDIFIGIGFSDETSAAIPITGADIGSLATAQGVGATANTATIDVTSLVTPYLNTPSKEIIGINLFINTAMGNSRGSLWYFMRLRVKNAGGTVQRITDWFDTSYANNVALPTPAIPLTFTAGVVTNVSPTFLVDVTAIVPIIINDAGTPARANDKATQIDLTVNTAMHSAPTDMASLLLHFTDQNGGYASGLNLGTFSTFDAPPHEVGVTQTYTPTDPGDPADTRYLFYVGQMFFNQPDPIDVDVNIAATDLIAWATVTGQQNNPAGTIDHYGGTLLEGYAGYGLLDWTITVPDPYTATPAIDGFSQLPAIVFIDPANGGFAVGSVSNLPAPVPSEFSTPQFTIGSNSCRMLVAFSLSPPSRPATYQPLLTTEPYEIRTRNQVALRFACTPPFTERPGDYTSPQFAVWLFGSQGEVDGKTLWTRLPFNVIGANGLVQHAIVQNVDAYPFFDFLPDQWAGTAIIFDNQEYATPWNYIRLLILPVAENDVSGYVLTVTANAREL